MENLEKLRENIDEIDENIVGLLEKRMEIVKKVGILKGINNVEIYDYNREKIVLEKIKKFLNNEEITEYLENIYIKIMIESKNYQKNIMELQKGE